MPLQQPCVTQQYTALCAVHYITLHYTTTTTATTTVSTNTTTTRLYYIKPRYTTQTTLHYKYNCDYTTLQYTTCTETTPHYATLLRTTLQYPTLHYTTLISPHHSYNCNCNYTRLIIHHVNHTSLRSFQGFKKISNAPSPWNN